MNLFFEPTFRTREFGRLLVSRLIDPVIGKCIESWDCVGSWQRRSQLLSCSSLDISCAEMSSSCGVPPLMVLYNATGQPIVDVHYSKHPVSFPRHTIGFYIYKISSLDNENLTHPLSSSCSFAMKFVAIFLGLVHLISVAGAADCGSACTYDSDCVNTLCNHCTSNQGPVNGVPQGICYQPDV